MQSSADDFVPIDVHVNLSGSGTDPTGSYMGMRNPYVYSDSRYLDNLA
jgi:hypothetical protein